MNFKSKIKSIIDIIKYQDAVQKRTRQNTGFLGITTLVLSMITTIMSYMNYIQDHYEMMAATIILTLFLLCVFILDLVVKIGKLTNLLFCLFLSIICLYFTLSGGNDGFAILWTLLLPSSVMLFMGFGYGIPIGVFFEIFFIALFWTPVNSIVSSYYSQTFMLRFPMLYTAFFVLSFLAKYFIVKQEISEHKALSENKAKSEFLSRVSHELRTPLNVILSMAKLGLNDRRLEESTDRFVKIISFSNYLSNIINDVLAMSNMESGKTEIKREPMCLKSAIEECAEFFKLQAKEKNIALVSSIDSDLPETLSGDEFHIRQILINLLSNAVKFTEKGQVSLDVKLMEGGGADKCEVLFTVADTGIGMSEEFLTKIFTPFEQEDSFINRRYEGSGLGLSISYNLLKLMGGNIKVESKLGEGSRFTYVIPFDIMEMKTETEMETEGKKEEKTTDSEEFSLMEKRILIADDIEINRLIMCEVFNDTGADLEEACDGEDVYKKFLQSPIRYYDCIFMDIQMPKMDGYTAAAAIRASGREDSNIPIIAMTAHALKEDIDSAITAGMNDYIAKPIDFAACLRKATQWCNR